jgi:hypothetical protein
MYGAVASRFSQDACEKYGMNKLYTLLTYLKRADVKLKGLELGALAIGVPQDDGTLVQKPFSECSLEEMRQAAKHLRKRGTPVPELDAARVKRYQDSLDRQLPAKHGIRVEARRHGDALVLSLRNVPEARMERLVAALTDTPAPTTGVPSVQAATQGNVGTSAVTPPTPSRAAPPEGRTGGTGLRGLLRRQLQRAVGT